MDRRAFSQLFCCCSCSASRPSCTILAHMHNGEGLKIDRALGGWEGKASVKQYGQAKAGSVSRFRLLQHPALNGSDWFALRTACCERWAPSGCLKYGASGKMVANYIKVLHRSGRFVPGSFARSPPRLVPTWQTDFPRH